MNCTEFESSIQHAIESRQKVDIEPYRQHVGTCSSCRNIWEQYAILETAIAPWASRLPEADLVDRIVSAHIDSPSSDKTFPVDCLATTPNASTAAATEVAVRFAHVDSAPSRSNAHRTAAIAVTVLAMLCMTSIFLFPHDLPNASNNTVAIESANREGEAVRFEDSTELVSLATEAGTAYVSLAQNAASAFSGVSDLLARPSIPAVQPTDSEVPPSESSPPWQNRFEPISRDLGRAMNYLLQAVPQGVFQETAT